MSWHFVAMKDEEDDYHVHELYEGYSWTGPIKPYGESVEELIKELEMMLSDVRKHGEYIDESNRQ